jgi:hypothetical protein
VVLYSCSCLCLKHYLKDDCVFHNARKDEDRSTDLPCGQLADNVGISESSLELEQVNVNFLEAIQHSETGSVWCNQIMKGDILFISDIGSMLVVLISSQGLMIHLERGS